MASEVHAEDPCPELPATFADPGKMREIAREIKGFTTESQVVIEADDKVGAEFKERPGRPEILVKSVVATRGNIDALGPQLASAAYARGFFAALRKAFVADGSDTNWSVWRRFFSHFTPILDFVHALCTFMRCDGRSARQRRLVGLLHLGAVALGRGRSIACWPR